MTTGSNGPGTPIEGALNHFTDPVVSAFEEKLRSSILTKTLFAANDGLPLKLTDEELAYLTKNAIEESLYSQMEVKTPAPTITLKKGKTELNIKNAATILQKMEEKYPTPKNPPLPQPFVTVVDKLLEEDDAVTEKEIEEIIKEVDKEMSNPGSSNKVHISSKPDEEKGTTLMKDHFKRCVNFPHSKVRPELAAAVIGEDATKIQPINTVNRNAYEIREGVLSMAVEFAK